MTKETTVLCPICDRSWVLTYEEHQEIPSDGYMVCSSCSKDKEKLIIEPGSLPNHAKEYASQFEDEDSVPPKQTSMF